MDGQHSWQTTSMSSETTEDLAAALAQNLIGGEVIELVSDLGGGKTTFVRGLARGLGSSNKVTSPTFKISNVYTSPTLSIYHFDFYRLPEAGLIAHELAEVIEDPKAVTVIEWGDIVETVLPAERLTIELKNQGEQQRQLSVSYPDSLRYLLKGLSQ
jgi:tRNA threonylcarbamoyladenosine biosynthesis protein TsaE